MHIPAHLHSDDKRTTTNTLTHRANAFGESPQATCPMVIPEGWLTYEATFVMSDFIHIEYDLLQS